MSRQGNRTMIDWRIAQISSVWWRCRNLISISFRFELHTFISDHRFVVDTNHGIIQWEVTVQKIKFSSLNSVKFGERRSTDRSIELLVEEADDKPLRVEDWAVKILKNGHARVSGLGECSIRLHYELIDNRWVIPARISYCRISESKTRRVFAKRVLETTGTRHPTSNSPTVQTILRIRVYYPSIWRSARIVSIIFALTWNINNSSIPFCTDSFFNEHARGQMSRTRSGTIV